MKNQSVTHIFETAGECLHGVHVVVSVAGHGTSVVRGLICVGLHPLKGLSSFFHPFEGCCSNIP